MGGDLHAVQAVLQEKTADAAYKKLVELKLADSVFAALAQKISQKAQVYVQKYADASIKVGTILFDRQGLLIAQDAVALELLKKGALFS